MVVTYALCTIADALAALGQMRRVLRPDGQLLFCEHGAAPDAAVRRWQDRLNGLWRRLAGGCNLNRPMLPLIEAGGFRIEEAQSAYLPGTPRFAAYNSWGIARPQ